MSMTAFRCRCGMLEYQLTSQSTVTTTANSRKWHKAVKLTIECDHTVPEILWNLKKWWMTNITNGFTTTPVVHTVAVLYVPRGTSSLMNISECRREWHIYMEFTWIQSVVTYRITVTLSWYSDMDTMCDCTQWRHWVYRSKPGLQC